jgi:hypothetical protein
MINSIKNGKVKLLPGLFAERAAVEVFVRKEK